MIEDDIEKQISLKMKFELLARFFYYIEQNQDIPFSEIDSDEQRLCYFVAHRFIQENKADVLLKALINENDEDYIKAIKDYIC
ncbi:TPA_asm: hypothetical protein GDN52_22375 [Salmonella enterica subsp. enterica serovar Litchfield]|uniref:Uncharacterized protein n=1 Tax=Salmonella enterica subsp. enterica serovar Litchfield TaxID=486998 RepID=A0A6W0NPS8_SALET|nr:hypothetical protein [Salmonella enterica subsp. enterica serovar Litchfield]EMB6210270.1 hypothetical protein [Morganella morganii]EEW9776861.1 hypothetical protein [Salmonella enterica subsp. enterica serovar Litchfield]HAA1123884.1 hypothetical protein [Salmonella enterica subsp. enterica serovar Litchfield]HAA1140517.1 hypothetical protein [Salmonella enterica subsp. enterica serovar Litchfield]